MSNIQNPKDNASQQRDSKENQKPASDQNQKDSKNPASKNNGAAGSG